MGLGIHTYQDQIQELISQVTKDKILAFLEVLKEKVMGWFSRTADVEDTHHICYADNLKLNEQDWLKDGTGAMVMKKTKVDSISCVVSR